LNLEVISLLDSEADGTRLRVRAQTHWPTGRRLIGRLVELAILSRREVETELGNLKTLVERESEWSH
jgi:hypothetical protein